MCHNGVDKPPESKGKQLAYGMVNPEVKALIFYTGDLLIPLK
jgi:hypothetical protein